MLELPTSIPIPPWLGWCLIGLVAAGMLALIGRYLLTQRRQQRSLVDRIDRILPQTQCGQCGYEGCRPYARAISAGAAINKCPPGGHVTIVQLADLLNELPTPLDPAHGQPEHAKVARIREAECIGCKKCIRACPVDAILGATKQMHTVIESECTGCDLCVEPCPVDCIDMVSIAEQPAGRCELPGRVNNPLDELEAAYR